MYFILRHPAQTPLFLSRPHQLRNTAGEKVAPDGKRIPTRIFLPPFSASGGSPHLYYRDEIRNGDNVFIGDLPFGAFFFFSPFFLFPVPMYPI